MTGVLTAILVGMLFASGTYLLLRREPIKLILGLNLLAYGVNVLLFSTSTLQRGDPPVVADKTAFAGAIDHFVDPLPQALILTAIVISFGVTAFVVVLINRRNTLTEGHLSRTSSVITEVANDPFATTAHFLTGLDRDPDDYEWIEDIHPDESGRSTDGK